MQLSRFIDHTLLKPEATKSQILKLCQEALENNFFSVCINSRYVSVCAEALKGSNVKVCSVVGFPLGAMSSSAKAFETAQAISDGADEIDMVLSIGSLKDGADDEVLKDIREVVLAAKGRPVKVILETSLLSTEEKKRACELSLKANAHFVKTSTGFNGGGATLEDIQLMKSIVGDKLEVKASGGIKTSAQAQAFLKAGASRLGTSGGVQLVQDNSTEEGSY